MPVYALTIQVVMTVLLGIRLISRFQRMGGRLGLDDAFISMAWIIGTAGVVLTLLGELSYALLVDERLTWVKGSYRYGFDRHIWDVSPELWPKSALVYLASIDII
jgi:hypothetical protein